MAVKRLGKRERELVKAGQRWREADRAKVQAFVARNLSSPVDPKYVRTPNGSSDSEARLRSAAHTPGFRASHAGYGKREIAVVGRSLGSVPKREGWHAQAPLPDLTHDQLRALNEGQQVMPVEREPLPRVSTYATAPTVKRFTKTK
jgi:hypothetical protein